MDSLRCVGNQAVRVRPLHGKTDGLILKEISRWLMILDGMRREPPGFQKRNRNGYAAAVHMVTEAD